MAVSNEASALVMGLIDYGNEKSTVRVEGEQLTALNFDAQMTLMGNLEAAVNAVTLMEQTSVTYIAYSEDMLYAKPELKSAQREQIWMVLGHDTVTGEKRRFQIAGADPALIKDRDPLQVGPDYMDLTGTEGAALKTAIEAFWRGGEAGANPVVVDAIMYQGRNT